MSPDPADIVAQVNAAMGEGSIRLGSDPSLVVKYLPTGIFPIDMLLQGGIPRNRSIEIYGDYSSLKSYIAYRTIATTQANGGTAALIDTEHAYDPEWVESLGADSVSLVVMQPETGEEAIMVADGLIRNGIDLIVWDSVAATMTKQYAEKAPGEDSQPADLARFMSKSMRRLTAANKHTALLFLNQTRTNLALTYGGARDSMPGGKALPYYASMRLRMVKAGKITRDVKVHDGEKMVTAKETVAMKVKAQLEKSKLNRPHREEWFLFDHQTGEVDVAAYLISRGLEMGIVEQNGSMWTIPDYLEDKVRGREKFADWLREDEEAQEWLKEAIQEGEEG